MSSLEMLLRYMTAGPCRCLASSPGASCWGRMSLCRQLQGFGSAGNVLVLDGRPAKQCSAEHRCFVCGVSLRLLSHRFDLVAPSRFGLVCLRLKGADNEGNKALLAAVNNAGNRRRTMQVIQGCCVRWAVPPDLFSVVLRICILSNKILLSLLGLKMPADALLMMSVPS